MSASALNDFCGLCLEHADACACRCCDACNEPCAVEHADPEYYDEATDKVLCSRCNAEQEAMRRMQTLRIAREQERLERAGWLFDVTFLPSVEKWSVRVHWCSCQESFVREDRTDAMAQALQYASLMNKAEEVSHAAAE